MAWGQRWAGRAAIVVGSGPSVRMADLLAIHDARRAGDRVRVIVCNSTFVALPTADVLMGHDPRWWHNNLELVNAAFTGKRVSVSGLPEGFNVARVGPPHFDTFGNSGTAAAALAIFAGCSPVVLVGMDCDYAEGPRGREVRHWHDKHAPTLGNAVSVHTWPQAWARLAGAATRAGARVVNATRGGKLEHFPRQPLVRVLAEINGARGAAG